MRTTCRWGGRAREERTTGTTSTSRVRREDACRVVALTLICLLFLAGCGGASVAATTSSSNAAQVASAASPSTDPPLTYVAIGASDAFGVGASDPIHRNWPALLAAKIASLNGTTVHLVDLGIPGATVAQAMEDELPVLQDTSPNIITVLLGTNDVLANTPLTKVDDTFGSLVLTLRLDYPNALLLIGNMPDLARVPYFATRDTTALRNKLDLLNTTIATLCAQTGATLVDIFDATAQGISAGDIASDGLHPTDAGAAAIATTFATALQQREHPTSTPTPTATPTGTFADTLARSVGAETRAAARAITRKATTP